MVLLLWPTDKPRAIRTILVAGRGPCAPRAQCACDRNRHQRGEPVPRARAASANRPPPGFAAVLINRAHTCPDLDFPINAVQERIFAAIEGRRSIGEIMQGAARSTDNEHDRRFFGLRCDRRTLSAFSPAPIEPSGFAELRGRQFHPNGSSGRFSIHGRQTREAASLSGLRYPAASIKAPRRARECSVLSSLRLVLWCHPAALLLNRRSVSFPHGCFVGSSPGHLGEPCPQGLGLNTGGSSVLWRVSKHGKLRQCAKAPGPGLTGGDRRGVVQVSGGLQVMKTFLALQDPRLRFAQ